LRCGLDDHLEADPLLAPDRVLHLGHQHVQGVDVGRGAHLGDHDQVEPVAPLLNHVDHVPVHVVSVQPVDPEGQGLGAPIHVADRLDHVLAGLDLVVRGHRILQVQEHHIRRRGRRLFEQFWTAARHRQLAAIEPRRGRLDDGKTHWSPGVCA
jgi:hypothetical protein